MHICASKEHALVDIMLRARLHARALHAEDRLVRGLAREERVRAEALPVAAALRDASR